MSRRRFGFSLAQLFLFVALAGLAFSLCRQLWILRLDRARRPSYSVYSVAFSPDGRLLAIGTDGLKLWDVASERIVFETLRMGAPRWRNGAWDLAGERIVETAPYVVSTVFSPDGKTLATTHSQMSPGTRLWDVETKQLVAAYDGRIMAAAAFSPDGKTLASAYYNRRLVLRNADNGKQPVVFDPEGEVDSLAFSPDGKVLAIAGDLAQFVRLWDVESEKLVGTLPGMRCVAFSPDGRTLAAPGPAISNEGGRARFDNGAPEVVRLWDRSSWTVNRTLQGEVAGIDSVAFSLDGSTLACADMAGVVRLFDVQTGDLTRTIELSKVATGVSTSLAFAPDGKTLAVGLGEDNNGRVALVDVASGGHRYIVWFRNPRIPWPLYGAGLVLGGVLWWNVRRRRAVAVAPDPLAGARG